MVPGTGNRSGTVTTTVMILVHCMYLPDWYWYILVLVLPFDLGQWFYDVPVPIVWIDFIIKFQEFFEF